GHSVAYSIARPRDYVSRSSHRDTIMNSQVGSRSSASLFIAAPLVCVPALLLSGCMQSRVEESREMPSHIGKGEAVVILAKPQVEGAGAEDGFMDCVSDELKGGKSA